MLSTFMFLYLLVSGETVIKVQDYMNQFSGNASACINYCLEKACKSHNHGRVTVLFPPKVTLNLTGNKMLKMTGCTVGLTVDGNGAKLIQTNPLLGVFRFHHCDSLLVKNLTIDYNPLPFTQGRVKRIVSKDQVEIAVDIGFPSPMDWYFSTSETKKWGLLRDNKPPYLTLKLGTRSMIGIHSWKSGGVVDGHEVYTVVAHEFSKLNVEVSDPWVHVARVTSGMVFLITHSYNVSFEDITIYTAPGASYSSYHNSNMSFIRSHTVVWPGRYISTMADGIFSVANRNGPKIKSCILQAIGDDALILKDQGYSVETVEENGLKLTLVLRPPPTGFTKEEREMGYMTEDEILLIDPFYPLKDDTLAAYNPESGTYLGTAKVLDVNSLGGDDTIFTLDVPFDGLWPGTEWNSTIVYNLNASNEGWEVTGTTVYSARRWGLLTMSPSGIVTHNNFIGNAENAVMIINSGINFGDSAGFLSTGLIIANNTFSDNLRDMRNVEGDTTAVIASAIYGLKPPKSGNVPKGKLVPWKGYRNIQIYHNTITQETGNFPSVLLRNVDGGIFAGNFIRKNNSSPGISIYDAQSITVNYNVFTNGCITIDTNSTTNVFLNGNILPSYCN